jgi:hypothetical protein
MTTETLTKPVLKFERKTCGRCGGCGQFSYNQMTGSTCFGCDGKGQVLTSRGQRALQWMRDRLSIRADEVKVGQRVNIPGCGKFNVVSTGPGSISKSKNFETGEWVEHQHFDLNGKTLGYSAFPDTKVMLVLPAAEHNALLAEAIAYQNTL